MYKNKPNMADIDYRALPIADLMREIGRQLRAHIKQQSTLSTFAKRSGVPSRTLTRLVSGGDVGIETLYRVLRTLERWDLLVALLRPPEPTPFDLLRKQGRKRPAMPDKRSGRERRPFEAHLAGSAGKTGDGND